MIIFDTKPSLHDFISCLPTLQVVLLICIIEKDLEIQTLYILYDQNIIKSIIFGIHRIFVMKA